MSAQTHRIKRLVFEFEVGQETQARRIHDEMSHVCQARIVPLLDRCLNETGMKGRLLRIDSLELDLGAIDPANLEEDMLARLEDAISGALRAQQQAPPGTVGRAPSDAEVDACLELLTLYAGSGCLPWWADHTSSDPLSGTLDYLLREAPAELGQLMRDLVKDDRSLTRIVHQCDDRLLTRLGALRHAAQAEALELFPLALVQLLQEGAARRDLPSAVPHPRQQVWKAILRTSSQSAVYSSHNLTFWRDVLLQLAQSCRTRYDTLILALQAAVSEGRAGVTSKSLHRMISALYQQLPLTALPATSEHKVATSDTAAVPSPAHSKTAAAGRWAMVLRLLERLRDYADLLRDVLATNDARALDVLLADVIAERPDLREARRMAQALRELITELVHARLMLPAGFGERLRKDETLLRQVLPASEARALEALLRDGSHEQVAAGESRACSDRVFSEVEEAYVDNAGLVILWPFLQRFFGQLDLLLEKRFKDAAAAHRAVGLLQYLVTEDPLGPEYLLPLNKVLCGMEPGDLFDFGPPLRNQERTECEQLLEAVIGNAPILRNMSIAGFRGSFLLRKGILDSRDGAWLLRVERESFDVVLDRFPWSFSWIKLPWMRAPLRVEW